MWPLAYERTYDLRSWPASLPGSLSTRLLVGDRPKPHSFMPSEKGGKEKQLTKKKWDEEVHVNIENQVNWTEILVKYLPTAVGMSGWQI